ncbi:putative WD40/YVTN repeat-like-containing domain-containing protein [Rosa chinensis]|uniref:Putative WD40/YVTN repeat-like-containing domain-containing protein n=1 Tax=Rosa chinensis TaxID=74649 RepID=A0A2P6QW74_ROSCH|nr:putative WD40/YVTN repeat-like-containing domain-containing protein [Rosa chinensis]
MARTWDYRSKNYVPYQVYRVSDMELVRILPSAEDEVNVACFHPSVGGGLVYGTKEGKLRILQYDSSHVVGHTTSNFLNENMLARGPNLCFRMLGTSCHYPLVGCTAQLRWIKSCCTHEACRRITPYLYL